jgi:hypothetical protein
MSNAIPKTLADGRVVAALSIDEGMAFTGALRLFAGEQKVGRASKLAIVKRHQSDDLLVVHCDQAWNVLGIQAWNAQGGRRVQSIQEAKAIVERYYTNSSEKWVQIDK